VVVGHAQHLDAGCLQPGLGLLQLGHRIDAQGQVIDPGRRVGRGLGGRVVAQVEEGDVRAVTHLEKDVHIGAVLAGAGYHVALDHMHQGQAQQVLIEMARLLAIPAAPGEVMQRSDGDEISG